MTRRKDGTEVLKEIRCFDRETPVIMISEAAPSNSADAMKDGANGFIRKPINPENLRRTLKMVLAERPARTLRPLDPNAQSTGSLSLCGTSPPMRRLQTLLDQIGWSDAPVLIQGETGVGKEVLAREVHARSQRAKQSLLKLNCAALPSELVESELFGYERGAFTGAFQRKPGMFELADGGTLLLDEIGDMDYKLQAKLLQVLQDQEFQRLGGRDTVRVNVRVISASHRDLEKAIAESLFREDLYYRLNVISLCVPPLRERKEDIIPLAEFLLRKHSDSGAEPVQLPPTLKDAFLNYHWPGNVRELENTIRRLLIFRNTELVELELLGKFKTAINVSTQPTFLQDGVPQPQPDVPAAPVIAPVSSAGNGSVSALEQLARANREAEQAAILAALKTTNWNRRQAAVLLQVEYKALLYKMKMLSIRKEKSDSKPQRARETPIRRAAVVAIGG
jgi:two-component system response regulator AtoC